MLRQAEEGKSERVKRGREEGQLAGGPEEEEEQGDEREGWRKGAKGGKRRSEAEEKGSDKRSVELLEHFDRSGGKYSYCNDRLAEQTVSAEQEDAVNREDKSCFFVTITISTPRPLHASIHPRPSAGRFQTVDFINGRGPGEALATPSTQKDRGVDVLPDINQSDYCSKRCR
ncbi:hypothetical protein EYF80_000685 [Liparis tanakae]|uniref:Uncharacterized protein n=1 Tax=Liparis tanakae TaxID=230148 RepID=A0A4Z2JHH0_9TELE|nr:hypothetical protein EYF80_000685 [Liparis tanakae]